MRSWLLRTALCGAVAFSALSAGAQNRPPLTITWGEDDNAARTFDPRVTQSRHESQLIVQVFDTLIGSDGNDVLYGSSGTDTFVFGNTDDTDVINGFANNIDTLDLRDVTEVTSWLDLKTNHATQDGANVVLDFGSDEIITIKNFTIAQLQDDVLI